MWSNRISRATVFGGKPTSARERSVRYRLLQPISAGRSLTLTFPALARRRACYSEQLIEGDNRSLQR